MRAENKSESLLMIDGKDSGRLSGQVHHAVVLQRFHRPANNHLHQTPSFGKQYEQFGKVFSAKFRDPTCVCTDLFCLAAQKKANSARLDADVFICIFQGCKKMSKTNESCAQLQELIQFNKYKLRLRCRCEAENYSIPVQGTLFNWQVDVLTAKKEGGKKTTLFLLCSLIVVANFSFCQTP